MVPNDYLISSLATLMASEPKDDGLLGFTACGLVVRNRVVAGWYGGDWATLINKHDTFSAYPDGGASRVLKVCDPHHDTTFRRCLGIAEQIFNGREKDLSEGALWYCRLDNCSEDFKNKIIRPKSTKVGVNEQEHQMVARIGMQMFFK